MEHFGEESCTYPNQWVQTNGCTRFDSRHFYIWTYIGHGSKLGLVRDSGLVTLFFMPSLGSGIAAGLAPQKNQYSVSPIVTSQYRGPAFQTTF